MDRNIYYSGQIPLTNQFLLAEKAKMIGLGMLARALYGDGTVAAGLACAATAPATLSVNVGPGSIYALENVDNSAFGGLAADTADQIVKQGVQLGTTNLAVAAPTTAGYSVNYLIEAAFSEADSAATILPYYNAADPSVSLVGPGGAGTSQNTIRGCGITLTAKAGTAAATGTQTTPAPDAGNVGLYVVTVAYGATSVIAANISVYPGAPIVGNLPNLVQSAGMTTANDTGAVNTYALTLSPAPSALTPGMVVHLKDILNTNSGAATLNVNGFGAIPIHAATGSALQGGELVATYAAVLMLNSAGTAWDLLATTGQDRFSGRLLNIQTFTASGTYNPTPGTKKVKVTVMGGGGGSAGTNSTSSSQVSLSSGGNSGSWGIGIYSNPGTQTVTIGAGGIAGTAGGGAGGTGGTSSFGALLTAPGGQGGVVSTTETPPFVVGPLAPSQVASGGNVVNLMEVAGGVGSAPNLTGTLGGARGCGLFGSSYGAGAVGRAVGISAPNYAGYAGNSGIVIVEEYA